MLCILFHADSPSISVNARVSTPSAKSTVDHSTLSPALVSSACFFDFDCAVVFFVAKIFSSQILSYHNACAADIFVKSHTYYSHAEHKRIPRKHTEFIVNNHCLDKADSKVACDC